MTANNYVVENGYIILPITTNPHTIYLNAVKAINETLPGWVPRESQLDNILLEQFAAMTAQAANVAAAVPQSIFAYYGALLGITASPGAPATALTTWTMVDTKGYTIPSGAVVGYQVLGNQLLTFQTLTKVSVPKTRTEATTIPIQATSVGALYSGLATGPLVLVSPALAFVRSVYSTTPTTGGETPETLTAYLNRLSNELQLLSPRPILTPDFAILARNVPGVYRAVAYNNLNPYANNFTAETATFKGGLGTWSVVSGCSISNVTRFGMTVMQIKASGSVNAVVETGTYPIPQTTFCEAVLSMDRSVYRSTPRKVRLTALCYNITTTLITGGTFTSHTTSIISPTPTATAPMTFVSLGFTTPPNTVTVRIRLTVETPTATEYQYVAYPGLLQLRTAPVNLVPNSSINGVDTDDDTDLPNVTGWVLGTDMAIEIFASQQHSIVYTGNGLPSGSKEALSLYFYLPAGTYFASTYIDATNISVGYPKFIVRKGLSTVVASAGQTSMKKGTVSTTFTLTAPAMVTFIMDTNNCTTVHSGLTLTFASPLVSTGIAPQPYSPGPAWGPPNVIYTNERMVTVAAVAKTGGPLDSAVEAAVSAYLESLREVNFIVNVIGPSYTTIDVTWAGYVTTTVDPTVAKATATTALHDYLTPAQWAGGTLTPPAWNPNLNVVRYLEVATVLGETAGLTLTSLQIGYHGGTKGNTDLPLAGFAPLPKPGTLTGSVVVA